MSRARRADVVVLGGGLVGLCCARALARVGREVLVVSSRRPGEASSASAGMLAPALERGPDDVSSFAVAARDCYPQLVRELEEATGVHIALNRLGILELAIDDIEAERLAQADRASSEWLDSAALAREEPALRHVAGALLHHGDGCVDNISLLYALRVEAERQPGLGLVHARALRLRCGSGAIDVELCSGDRLDASQIVLALGAWTGRLQGLPRPLPVEPLRGQLVTLAAAPLSHVCYDHHRYLVPRPGGQTLLGSTMDRAGFAPGSNDAAVQALAAGARRLAPALTGARELARWSGLRPATPDLLPIIGAEPADPRLLYACGHSRSGILLAPLTGEVIARIAAGEEPAVALGAFSVERFPLEQRGQAP